MISRRRYVILFTVVLLLIVVPVTTYFVNPHTVKSDNIRSRLFGFDIYRIPSRSMLPLLVPGDYILVSNTAYLSKSPERKDVIVFWGHPQADPTKKVAFIKRVAAIEGDKIKIKGGKVYINDKVVDEPFVDSNNKKTKYSLTMTESVIEQGNSFVLGDNRDTSRDSRLFGLISNKEIIGKATRILFGSNNRSGIELDTLH